MSKRLLFFTSLTALFAVAAVAITLPATSYAQADNGVGGNGLRVSPVRTSLTIEPGASKVVKVTIQNITDKPAELKAAINDFVASDDESGSPRVILDENVAAPSHGLKSYIDKISNISLQANESKDVDVRISMPKNVAGGGYYGAVRFLPANVESGSNVSLSASVASLLLVTVPGDINEQASVSSFNVSRDGGKASNFFMNGAKDSDSKGLQLAVRIHNGGNVQVAPFGKVVLKKSGKVLSTQEINNVTPRGNVLPDSTRRFMLDFGDKTAGLGKYTVEGNFGYGGSGQLISAKTSFYVVPKAYVFMAVGLLLVLIAALMVAPRLLKSHDRKLLRKVRDANRK